MYIWVGINVDSQLSAVGERVREIEKKLGFRNFCYTLPMHISLKISFPVSDSDSGEIMSAIKDVFERRKAFEIEVSGIEFLGGIAWVRMKESESLISLSDELNSMLLCKFGIPLHEYDTDYKFHSTLFMGSEDEVRAECSMLGNINIPAKLVANRFVIGTSETGALGTYSVSEEIKV